MIKNQNKNSYIIIIIGYFLANCAESIVGPLYPIEAAKRGITEDIIGIIFAAHSIVAFVSSLVLGQIMTINGRKNLVQIGILLQMCGLIGFGLIIFIQDQTIFIILSTISRILEGIGYSLYCLPIFALIPSLYKDNYEDKIAYLESSGSVGLCLGYILGSGLYALGGYILPFILNAIALLIVCLFIYKCLIIDENQENQSGSEINNINDESQETITYTDIFLNKNIILTSIANIFPTIIILYLEPTFAIYLDQTLSIGQDKSGLYFFITTFVYIVFSSIVGYYMKQLNKKKLIFTGLIGFFIVCIFLGPEPILNIEPSVLTIVFSLFCLGLFEAIIYPPMMPEAMDNLQEIYPHISQEKISDYGSTIYNSTYILGEFIGPILGGSLAEYYTFPRASTYLGLLCLIYGIIYLKFAQFSKLKSNKLKSHEKVLLQCEIMTNDEL